MMCSMDRYSVRYHSSTIETIFFLNYELVVIYTERRTKSGKSISCICDTKRAGISRFINYQRNVIDKTTAIFTSVNYRVIALETPIIAISALHLSGLTYRNGTYSAKSL